MTMWICLKTVGHTKTRTCQQCDDDSQCKSHLQYWNGTGTLLLEPGSSINMTVLTLEMKIYDLATQQNWTFNLSHTKWIMLTMCKTSMLTHNMAVTKFINITQHEFFEKERERDGGGGS